MEVNRLSKQPWTAPSVEILDVAHTMLGTGTTRVDVVTTDDFDLSDPS